MKNVFKKGKKRTTNKCIKQEDAGDEITCWY